MTVRRTHSRARHWGWCIALACLLVRAMVPAGFMPGDLLAGQFAAPCPTGFPAAFFTDEPGQPAQAHHHDHGQAQDRGDGDDTPLDAQSLDNACPLGSALQAAAALPEVLPLIAHVEPVRPLFSYHTKVIPLRRNSGHRSRAPPLAS
ncbi:hypothetical protein F3N42_04920 [Marinihelvus fidelis]|uniref:DUF2946 domain-containing protein n=1 Tax=Marinihelvus fidelis TaxID=2613842 RepID=A0A5N0TC13_9GAMM|nr:hypothetical protein [Marinihelvus fidelis]KAA9132565.1 hypothetical protein F3N42_04920 [Marinihelvus fidelis]